MNEAIHFPLYLVPLREMPLTISQHSNLSFIGLANFMIHWPIVIADHGDYLKLYCEEWRGNYFHEMPRFAEIIPGRINQQAEMAYFKIPKETKLYATIQKYFKHLFLKKDA